MFVSSERGYLAGHCRNCFPHLYAVVALSYWQVPNVLGVLSQHGRPISQHRVKYGEIPDRELNARADLHALDRLLNRHNKVCRRNDGVRYCFPHGWRHSGKVARTSYGGCGTGVGTDVSPRVSCLFIRVFLSSQLEERGNGSCDRRKCDARFRGRLTF